LTVLILAKKPQCAQFHLTLEILENLKFIIVFIKMNNKVCFEMKTRYILDEKMFNICKKTEHSVTRYELTPENF